MNQPNGKMLTRMTQLKVYRQPNMLRTKRTTMHACRPYKPNTPTNRNIHEYSNVVKWQTIIGQYINVHTVKYSPDMCL